MSILLDTNVVSELRKPEQRADAQVRAWAKAHPLQSLHLSVVSVMEIEIGVARKERQDVRQGQLLRAWLEHHVLTAFANRIIPVDLAIARTAAALHVPEPRPERDALIAATAAVHDLVVATRNISDFESLGVEIVNPWRYE